jgi:hypothetical protein
MHLRILPAVGMLAAIGLLLSSDQKLLAVPIQDASLSMWLDGQDIDGDGVFEGAGEAYVTGGTARWRDKATPAQTHTASQTSAAQQPTLNPSGPNGLPSLTFASDKLLFAALDWIDTSAFIVAQRNGTTTAQLAAHSSINRQFRYNGSKLEITGSPDNLGVPSKSGSFGNFQIAESEVTGTSARVGLNGSFGTATSHSVSSFPLNQFGARGSGLTDALNGAMAEVIVYDRVLNSTERIVTENYLNSKYNLDNNNTAPIAANRYLGDLNSKGDYDFDVFGVGQDTTGDALTSGNSAGLHLDVNSGLENGDFYLAGHKTFSNSPVTTDLLTPLAGRIDRVWYLDQTDDNLSANLDVTFDLSEAGINLDSNMNYYLLKSATNAFEAGEMPFGILSSMFEANGDRISFANLSAASLTDGYYTLGFAPIPAPEPSSFLLLGLGAIGLFRRAQRRGGRAYRNKNC